MKEQLVQLYDLRNNDKELLRKEYGECDDLDIYFKDKGG